MLQVAVCVLALIGSSLATTVNVNPINPTNQDSTPTSYFIDAVTTITFNLTVDRPECLKNLTIPKNDTEFGVISYAGPTKRLVIVPFVNEDAKGNLVINIQAVFFDQNDTVVNNVTFEELSIPTAEKLSIMSLSFDATSFNITDNSDKVPELEDKSTWGSTYIDNLTGPDGKAYQCIKFYQDAKVTDCGFHLSFDNEVRYTLNETPLLSSERRAISSFSHL